MSPFGFATTLIGKLACPRDGATLNIEAGGARSSDAIRTGSLRCSECGQRFRIEDGILDLLGNQALDEESRHEQTVRNRSAQPLRRDPAEDEDRQMERQPTLRALSLGRSMSLLELGCGDGYYTVPLAAQCTNLLAVDFSVESLKLLRSRLPATTTNVGLVLGDVAGMKLRAMSFDRVLSTLVSNLPSHAHRKAMFALAARCLKPGGRLVFSTHHHGLRTILRGERKSARYRPGGIYRYNFTVRECRQEASCHFSSVRAAPVQIHVPLARRLGLPVVALSRLLERIPLVNRMGELVLCVAQQNAGTSE